jgi:hypothetical protein
VYRLKAGPSPGDPLPLHRRLLCGPRGGRESNGSGSCDDQKLPEYQLTTTAGRHYSKPVAFFAVNPENFDTGEAETVSVGV